MTTDVIYIPLCIYFNGLSRIRRLQSLNLHSTMYLFQLFSTMEQRIFHFHLHSTMYLFQLIGACGTFLATLLFTFHYVSISTRASIKNEGGAEKFTFHYVSISTLMSIVHFDICNAFTFHYVSISTRKLNVSGYIQTYLHSTMYLFQLINYQARQNMTYIYIPLCIYFNGNTISNCDKSRLFTFHYVSISTLDLQKPYIY